jgi:hypothetical protein
MPGSGTIQAFGGFLQQDAPYFGYMAVRGPHGGFLTPGSKVAAYVRSTGAQSGDPPELNVVTTLAKALPYCRSGYNDVIYVLPNHSESVTDATMLDGLVAGTQIIGLGGAFPSNAPTFRWTATTSEWNIDVANVTISGLKLRMEGASGVVLPIDINAAGFTLANCDIETASGASNKCTQIADLAAVAGFNWLNCRIRGTNTHNSTNGLTVAAAATDWLVSGLYGHASFTAANGFINVTAASLRWKIQNCELYNDHTSSTACIQINHASATGMISRVNAATINNGTANAQGIVITAGVVRCFECYSSDESGKSGVITPGVVAT